MSGFVVCTKCGTRIKAGRGHCLRCFEPLPDPDDPVRPPIWESLGLSQSNLMIITIIASVAVLGLIVVIWTTWPEPVDEVTERTPVRIAEPVTPPAGTTPAAAAAPVGSRASVDPLTLPDEKRPELSAAERADLEARGVEYEQALTKTPDNPELLNNLGQVLARLGQPQAALARFERAVVLAPARPAYHFNLARAATEMGNRSRAVESLREAVRLLPNDGATHYTLGVALLKNNDTAAALPELEQAIALSPGDPKAHLAYGVGLEQTQRLPDAIREYTRFVEMRPNAPEADGIKTHIEALRQARP